MYFLDQWEGDRIMMEASSQNRPNYEKKGTFSSNEHEKIPGIV